MTLRFACLVTGTDTDVGKTLVAAALLHRCRARGWSAVGMKPVAAGCQADADGGWRNADVDMLRAASSPELLATVDAADLNPYRFVPAIAPHLAAARLGQAIEPARILAAYARLAAQAEAVVVEGAGGFRIPLGADGDSADLARALGLPVVLVVGLRLGCLNHALLTQEAILARGLRLAGWVANGIDPAMSAAEENLATLQALLAAPLLGVLPHLATPEPALAAGYLTLPG